MDAVFPARAGMSPAMTLHSTGSQCFPRPRGDEPSMVETVASKIGFSPPARG